MLANTDPNDPNRPKPPASWKNPCWIYLALMALLALLMVLPIW